MISISGMKLVTISTYKVALLVFNNWSQYTIIVVVALYKLYSQIFISTVRLQKIYIPLLVILFHHFFIIFDHMGLSEIVLEYLGVAVGKTWAHSDDFIFTVVT